MKTLVARSWFASTSLAFLVTAGIGCPTRPVAPEQAAPVVAGTAAQASQPAATALPPLPPPQVRPPSAGVITCGSIQCDAKATACVLWDKKPPQCVPRAERDRYAQGGRSEDSVLDCDDDADCPTGQRCCAGQYWGGTGPHIHMCEKDKCADAIACLPATGCPANLMCKQVGQTSDYHCEPAVTGVSCGAARCTGSTPVCCWDIAKSTGRCMAEPMGTPACAGDDEGPIRCRGRRDCGGYDCCLYMARGSGCSSSCPGASIGVACETFADCPSEGPGPGGMPQRYDRCESGACTGKLCNIPMKGWAPCDEE